MRPYKGHSLNRTAAVDLRGSGLLPRRTLVTFLRSESNSRSAGQATEEIEISVEERRVNPTTAFGGGEGMMRIPHQCAPRETFSTD